jgi:ABC-type nitrate/sulfonate/bicarbonate transport system substrate-binding protein/outer membrane protein OmpA-like peptidoglycan-associated protein
MGRIRWGNVVITTAVLLGFVYAALLVVGVAPQPKLPGTAAATEVASDDLSLSAEVESIPPHTTPAPTAAPTEAAAAPEAALTLEPTLMPTPLVAPTQLADDTGFQSEVDVPESTGAFPLGTITVAFDKEFPPYSPVVMLYQQKLAEKRGLGVHFVPFDIEDKNRISETRRGELLQNGGFDVLLTTMNSYALWGGPDVGRVTTIIGESAGADKAIVDSSKIKTFNDFYGKAVSYSDSSVSEYLLYYMLRAGGVPAQGVIRFGQENLNQAVRRFDDRESHAVVGWTSSDLDQAMKQPGAKVLMTSDQFRVTTDVIVTGVKALETKPAAVQAFHDAWFEANKMVFEHPDQAAASMNAWNGSWTGVQTPQDLTDALGEFAQATLADNGVMFSDTNLPVLEARYKEAEEVWGWGGRDLRQVVSDQNLATVFDPTFVRKSAQDSSLVSTQPPVNPTFHLTANPQVKGLSPEEQSRLLTVATLDVKQLQFAQGSADLSAAARQQIEASVIPVLRNTVGTYLKIQGSAGWPEKAGLTEASVNSLAFERARAVQDYIIKFGIPVERLVLGTQLPVCRECKDTKQVQSDNTVVFNLATQ